MTSIASIWRADGRLPSGFDYMRVTLAICVLLWHSAQMSYGTAFAIELWQSPLGYIIQLILPMFFSLSGFLVTSSLERTGNLYTFLSLRGIRIYPALCVEVALSGLLLGPLVTDLPLKAYFSSTQFYSYLANVTGYIHFRLPGVFTHNPLPGIVNTSLWTVPYELECYVLISILFLCGYMKSLRVTAFSYIFCTAGLAIWMTKSHQHGVLETSLHGRVLVLCFLAGSVLYRAQHLVPYDWRLALGAALASIFMFRSDGMVYLAPLFGAYFTIWLGLRNPKRTVIISTGDYSYGTYLYAGPIQQTCVWALGSANSYFTNVILALPITIAFALFSWHAVEKPFMRVKRFIQKPRRPAMNLDALHKEHHQRG